MLRVPGRQNRENATILGQTKNPAAKPEGGTDADGRRAALSEPSDGAAGEDTNSRDPMLLLPCEGRTGPAAESAGGRRGSGSTHS